MRRLVERLRNVIAGALFLTAIAAGVAPMFSSAVASAAPAIRLSATAVTTAIEVSAVVVGALVGFMSTGKKTKTKT